MDTNIRTAVARQHCPRCGRAKNACCGLAMHDEITRLRAELDLLKQEVFAVREQHGNALIERDRLAKELSRKPDEVVFVDSPRIAALEAERDRLAAKNVNLNILLKDICDEWNEGCDPACDSFGHTDTCKGANIAQAKRAMRDEITRLRAELAAAQERIADLERAGNRALSWLSSYPGGCAINTYKQMRAALAAKGG